MIEVFLCPECKGPNRVEFTLGEPERPVNCIHCRRTEWEPIDPPPAPFATRKEAKHFLLDHKGPMKKRALKDELKAMDDEEIIEWATVLSDNRYQRGPKKAKQVGCTFQVKQGSGELEKESA